MTEHFDPEAHENLHREFQSEFQKTGPLLNIHGSSPVSEEMRPVLNEVQQALLDVLKGSETDIPVEVVENGIRYSIQTDEYGDQRWFIGEKCYRYVHISGSVHYYGRGIEGEHHRDPDPITGEDLPSIEYANGDRMFYWLGLKHREGKPARVFADKEHHYYEQDKRHRLNGPAIDRLKGKNEYWFEGEKISCANQDEFETIISGILSDREKEEKKRERQEKKKLLKMEENHGA